MSKLYAIHTDSVQGVLFNCTQLALVFFKRCNCFTYASSLCKIFIIMSSFFHFAMSDLISEKNNLITITTKLSRSHSSDNFSKYYNGETHLGEYT